MILLLWANLKRKKIRTCLTLASFAVALFLFGLLSVIHGAFYKGVEVAGVDRLVVRNKTSLIMPLPVSYAEKLKRIPGVREATYAFWFGGVYQNEKNFFPQFAVDVPTYGKMFSEFIIPPEDWTAFASDRQGAIVGRKTADRFGWKVGDRIPIKGTIFPGTWEFNLRGIYDGKTGSEDTTQFWFHYDYLEERADRVRGKVGWYFVKVNDPDRALMVSKAIDREFSNSSYETVSETEKAFTAAFVKQFGNIKLVILVVGSVVFFTLLLITGGNMGMAVRERTRDIGILKSLGFGDLQILAMVLAESLLTALMGGGLGLLLAKLFTLRGDPTGGMLPFFDLEPRSILLGLGAAMIVGLASGIFPAVKAMRITIIEALRRI